MHFISMYVFLRNPLIMLYPLSKNESLLRLQWWLERILISAEAHRWRWQSSVPTAWIHRLNLPCVKSPELWPLLNGVRNVLSWLTLGSLILIIHRLNFTACFAANYVPQLRNSLMALIYTCIFQHNASHQCKSHLKWFHEHDNAQPYSWLDLNLIEPL